MRSEFRIYARTDNTTSCIPVMQAESEGITCKRKTWFPWHGKLKCCLLIRQKSERRTWSKDQDVTFQLHFRLYTILNSTVETKIQIEETKLSDAAFLVTSICKLHPFWVRKQLAGQSVKLPRG